ncbi:MAG: hypothetical protein OXI50_05525 [Gammaproteobacteria bacterium]|nr:hypothetical protein [Gammaproteobacteria bacterium]
MLYEALCEILLDSGSLGGPLPNLFRARLPDEPTGAGVDVAFVPGGGRAPVKVLGSRPRPGASWRGPGGTAPHDGGVAWYRTSVQFQVRAAGDSQAQLIDASDKADAIRDVLVQYAGETQVLAGERIVRIDVTTSTYYLGQDRRERPMFGLNVECWHRPD